VHEPMEGSLVGSSIKSILVGLPDAVVFDTTAIEGSKPKAEDAFPFKVLKFLKNKKFQKIIQWCTHGRAFIISNQRKFESDVLAGIKYKSFVRLLNMWGFKRITQGADRGSYYHQFFLRGREFLIKFMQCEKNKGIGRRSSPNPQDEPDFYTLAKYRPLNDGVVATSSSSNAAAWDNNEVSSSTKRSGTGASSGNVQLNQDVSEMVQASAGNDQMHQPLVQNDKSPYPSFQSNPQYSAPNMNHMYDANRPSEQNHLANSNYLNAQFNSGNVGVQGSGMQQLNQKSGPWNQNSQYYQGM